MKVLPIRRSKNDCNLGLAFAVVSPECIVGTLLLCLKTVKIEPRDNGPQKGNSEVLHYTVKIHTTVLPDEIGHNNGD